jgi:DNA helicase-2/ATP-dependent DNA helicase PcrA
LRRFYQLNVPGWHKKVMLEEKVEAVLAGRVPLIGLVDKLELHGSMADIVDYKTGRYDKTKFQPPDPDKVKQAESEGKEPKFEHRYGGDYWRQGVFYKLLVENSPKHHYTVGTARFCFVEPDEKSGEFVSRTVEITPEDEDFVRRQIIDTYDRIMAREFGGRCGNSYCAWCR